MHWELDQPHPKAEANASCLSLSPWANKVSLASALAQAWGQIGFPLPQLRPKRILSWALLDHSFHCSHFGSRYKLGCCGNASLFPRVESSPPLAFRILRKTTPVGFKPMRGDPIGLAGRRLNRSAKVSLVRFVSYANLSLIHI